MPKQESFKPELIWMGESGDGEKDDGALVEVLDHQLPKISWRVGRTWKVIL